MPSIITEELRFRKLICEYAIKHKNNAEAARRYHTSRQQVQRWEFKLILNMYLMSAYCLILMALNTTKLRL